MTGVAYCPKPPELPLARGLGHLGWQAVGLCRSHWSVADRRAVRHHHRDRGGPVRSRVPASPRPELMAGVPATTGSAAAATGDRRRRRRLRARTWPLNSSYYGFKLYCYASSCNNQGYLKVFEVDLIATRNPGAQPVALGTNLWYQAGRWVWNPPGDPWSIAFATSDPSGVCNVYALVNGLYIQGPTARPYIDCLAPMSRCDVVERGEPSTRATTCGAAGRFR